MVNLKRLREEYSLIEPCLISSYKRLYEKMFTAIAEERAAKNEYRKRLEKELKTSFRLDSDPEEDYSV